MMVKPLNSTTAKHKRQPYRPKKSGDPSRRVAISTAYIEACERSVEKRFDDQFSTSEAVSYAIYVGLRVLTEQTGFARLMAGETLTIDMKSLTAHVNYEMKQDLSRAKELAADHATMECLDSLLSHAPNSDSEVKVKWS